MSEAIRQLIKTWHEQAETLRDQNMHRDKGEALSAYITPAQYEANNVKIATLKECANDLALVFELKR